MEGDTETPHTRPPLNPPRTRTRARFGPNMRLHGRASRVKPPAPRPSPCNICNTADVSLHSNSHPMSAQDQIRPMQAAAQALQAVHPPPTLRAKQDHHTPRLRAHTHTTFPDLSLYEMTTPISLCAHLLINRMHSLHASAVSCSWQTPLHELPGRPGPHTLGNHRTATTYGSNRAGAPGPSPPGVQLPPQATSLPQTRHKA